MSRRSLLLSGSARWISASIPLQLPIGLLPAPSLTLSSAVTKAEGDNGTTAITWTLTLNRDGSLLPYSFTWGVTGSGANPADAADFGGSLPVGAGLFLPGETTKTVTVLVAGDTAIEPAESFTLTVTAESLNTVTSTGTISNDDVLTAGLTYADLATTYRHGVNLSGMQYFDCPETRAAPMLDGAPIRPRDVQWDYLQAVGVKSIRLPVSWEILQRELFGTLGYEIGGYSNSVGDPDRNTLQMVRSQLDKAASRGMKCLLEIKNYGARRLYQNGVWVATGGYGHKGAFAIGSAEVPVAAYLDLLVKLVAAFGDHPGLLGIDIMNEPDKLGIADATDAERAVNGTFWATVVQQAVNAMRDAGFRHMIFAEGYSFANPYKWDKYNPTLHTVTDPLNNIIFSAHLYFDGNHAGIYPTSTGEHLAPVNFDTMIARMKTDTDPFTTWLADNNKRGHFGEFGAPNTAPWQEGVRQFMNRLNGVVDCPYHMWGMWPLASNGATTGSGNANVNDLNRVSSAWGTGYATGPEMQAMKTLRASIDAADNSESLPLYPLPTVTLSADQAITEGNSGSQLVTFTVTRSDSVGAISVPWTFAAGTTNAADFGGTLPTGGTVAIANGQTTGTFSVSVSGDVDVESDETFSVAIGIPSGYAAGAKTSATGTILNDDVSGATVTAPGAMARSYDGSVGQTYTLTPATWSSGTPSRQWYREAAASPFARTAISNATGTTYVAQAADTGFYLVAVEANGGVTAETRFPGSVPSAPIALDLMEEMTGHSTVGTGTSLALDTANKVQGNAAIQVTAAASAGTAGIDFTGSVTRLPADLGNIAGYFKRGTEGVITGQQIFMHAGSTSGSILLGSDQDQLPGGRWVGFDTSEIAAFAAAAAAPIRIRPCVTKATTAGAVFTYDAWMAKAGGQPMVLLTFDDGYKTTRTVALPALAARKMRATGFPASKNVGTGSGEFEWMTASDLRDLRDAGWTIGADLTRDDGRISLDPDIAAAEAAAAKAELEAIIGRPVRFGCWPNGGAQQDGTKLPDNVAEAVLAKGFLVLRGTQAPRLSHTRFGIGLSDRKQLPSQGISNASVVSTLLALVDQAILRGMNVCFHLHSLTEATGNASFTPASIYVPFFDGLVTRRDAGQIMVGTYDDLWQRDGTSAVPL